jgi:protein JBTS26
MQAFIRPALAKGQFLRIRLLSTYGDKHYIGLNGIEIYDIQKGALLTTDAVRFKLVADPCMSDSSSSNDDKRVPENLYNGINDGEYFDKFFLAPYVNSKRLNHPSNLGREFSQILIFFDSPVTISKLTFWNYSKTFSRAVKDIEVFLDERLIFGVLCCNLGISE